MRDYENLIQQQEAEKHIISVSCFNHNVLNVMKLEDFIFCKSDFSLVKKCNGNPHELLKNKIKFYELQQNSIFLAHSDEKIISYLHENTFFRLAVKLLNDLRTNALQHEKKALYSDVLEKCYSIDVFDLIDFLPKYFDSIGMDSGRFYDWKNYCFNRIEKLRGYINGIN